MTANLCQILPSDQLSANPLYQGQAPDVDATGACSSCGQDHGDTTPREAHRLSTPDGHGFYQDEVTALAEMGTDYLAANTASKDADLARKVAAVMATDLAAHLLAAGYRRAA
jgi:hypothetical protein